MQKMTENAMRNIGGGKHYYVLKCRKCFRAFEDSWLGSLAMKLHIKSVHGSGSYYRKDVCTAMGQPHK